MSFSCECDKLDNRIDINYKEIVMMPMKSHRQAEEDSHVFQQNRYRLQGSRKAVSNRRMPPVAMSFTMLV